MPHDGPGEHYHDLGERVGACDDSVVWTTVGLDIGSSTSQAVFSRITLRRDDAYYVVVDREILHQSAVILTPYASPALIDEERLAAFFECEFGAANLTRSQIQAGAVIMTGLALSTRNSRAIADVIADDAGSFVAVSAGDLLEARLAAYGAGLPELSAQKPGMVLHVDMGGGTTKLSIWSAGRLHYLAAIDVGARLVTFNERSQITSIEPPLARLAEQIGIDLRIGNLLRSDVSELLCSVLASEVLRCGGVLSQSMRYPALLRTAPLFPGDSRLPISAVIFSGGVSEYIYGREPRSFGDLGMLLGSAVRHAVEECGMELLESTRGIRATVLGASQHSMQMSGNTIFVSDARRLPLRNLPIIIPNVSLEQSELDPRVIEAALDYALATYDGIGRSGEFGISIKWEGSPTYQRLETVAKAIARVSEGRLGRTAACIVIVDGDVAGLLGEHLSLQLAAGRPVICLDGVHVHEFDHMDIGTFTHGTAALPVMVKSLLFAQNREHMHVHRH